MEYENIPEFDISNDLCKETGIAAKWIGNKLSIRGYKHIFTTSNDKPSKFLDTGDIKVYHIQPELIYEDPILRSLIAEANSIFLTVQGMKKASKNDFVKISKTYRCILRACLEKLKEQIQIEDSNKEEKSKYENYTTIFYSVECIWHLCEILFIDPAPSNIIVPQLIEWIRFIFPKYETQATELLLQGREANNSSEYWSTVKGLILQGQIEVARAILQSHSLSETNAYRMAEQILKTMPTYNIYGGLSIQKFRSQWQYWLTDTEIKLSAGNLSSEPNLEEIVKLITGNPTAWNEVIKTSNDWYEFLPGFLFYTEPACKYFELGTLANCWLSRYANIKEYSQSGFLNHLDRVILNLMENDMQTVLHSIQKMCDNQWFVTHLTDLLYNCGQLQILGENQTNESKKLRDSLLFQFGSALMSRESLWMIGLDYLEYCSEEDRGAMELLLLRVPVKNEKQAFKIINAAKKKNIVDSIEPEICKVQARKSMMLDRYGNALDWAIRSKDSIFVTAITDYFLNHLSKTGEMLSPDVIENIGAKMFISPRLVFLVKYFDFRQHYTKREFIPATELLVNLLDSQITPEYFWPTLLIDTIPLLESKDPKIPSKETNIILHHLESDLVPLIEKKKNMKELNILGDYRIDKIEEIVKLIRFACARNLARAFVIENTIVV